MSQSLSRRTVARHIAAKLVANPKDRESIVKSVAAYLVDNNKTSQATLLVHDIQYELLERNSLLFGTITTAYSLTDDLKNQISELLKRKTSSTEVFLSEQTKPSLLGGFIIETADSTWDESLRSKLKRIASIE